MKKLSCVTQGKAETIEAIKKEAERVGLSDIGVEVPEDLIRFYQEQNIHFTYHRVTCALADRSDEYDIGYFEDFLPQMIDGHRVPGIIEYIVWFRGDEFYARLNPIVFSTSSNGDLFYISYGQEDLGKVYFFSCEHGDEVEPVLLAHSFSDFINGLRVDPEDMEALMDLPEGDRGDLSPASML